MAAKNRGDQTKIENSLLEQLAMLGAMKEHYIDLIRDYMGLWEVKTELLDSIRERRVILKSLDPIEAMMQKSNPAFKDLVMVNKQMMSILKELNLSTSNVGDGEVDKL